MHNILIRKLSHGAELTGDDRGRLEDLVGRSRRVEARSDVISDGDIPGDVHLILEGFACRYKIMPDGRRSIMAYLVPGDFCDLHVAILGSMDHSIGTMTACTLVEIPRATIEELSAKHPQIMRAMWWATLVDEATLRHWLVNIGRRPADQRLAHLLCEFYVRLNAVGVAGDRSYQLPLTQEDIADTLGISTVHVNRVLQRLRAKGLVTLQSRALTIPDYGRLEAFADFDPAYLHLDRPGRREHRP